MSRGARQALVVALLLSGLQGAGAQPQSHSRVIGFGAWAGGITGSAALGLNPAGLLGVRDWEAAGSSYITWARSTSDLNGPFIQGAILAKRFLDRNAFAIQYTPGASLSFHIPDTLRIVINDTLDVPLDRSAKYTDILSFGFARSIRNGFSFGVNAHLLSEDISERKILYAEGPGTDVAEQRESTVHRRTWGLDFGIRWEQSPGLTFGAATRNLFTLSDNDIPAELRSLSFRSPRMLRVGVAYRPVDGLLTGLDLDTEKRAALALQYHLPYGVAVRQTTYFDARTSRLVPALGFGVGWSSPFLAVDAGWLFYTDRRLRGGAASSSDFLANSIDDLVHNPFSSDRMALTVTAAFGRMHEPVARLDDIHIVDVYPSKYYVYAYQTVGRARVKNLTEEPVEVRVRFVLNGLMDSPTETKPTIIPPNGVADIPFTAIFNETIRREGETSLKAADVSVISSADVPYEDHVQAQVIVHGRNDWDGDLHALQYFVTPTDSEVMRFSRTVLEGYRGILDSSDARLNMFLRARLLFKEFSDRVTYVNDPRLSDDRVQFPAETFGLKGGDCDDMAVAFASILESAGIASAFIDIVPPDDPQSAHVFLMFDTGLSPELGTLIAGNPKRYIIRKTSRGQDRIWIPIETTAVTKGFETAWNLGAEEYFTSAELKSGLIEEWVRIVDIDLD